MGPLTPRPERSKGNKSWQKGEPRHRHKCAFNVDYLQKVHEHDIYVSTTSLKSQGFSLSPQSLQNEVTEMLAEVNAAWVLSVYACVDSSVTI